MSPTSKSERKELRLYSGDTITGEVLSMALDTAARDWRTTSNKCHIVDSRGHVIITVTHHVHPEDVEVLSSRELDRRYGKCTAHHYCGCVAWENGIHIYSRPRESFHEHEARCEAANLGYTVVVVEDLS